MHFATQQILIHDAKQHKISMEPELVNTRTFLSLLCLLLFAASSAAHANDGIFPPSPTASSSINFDGKGFIINGQRTFIASGGMEYARVPRALWRDRLLKMKRAGFNCTETYIFWNFHEPKENQWDFAGDHDLNAYLQIVHQLGMYAIVRIGPYVCAEWDSGGYPVWLRFKPGLVVRSDNQPFLDETFKYYGKVVPIIAANQISHGGSVILVQIENEYGPGWGTDSNSYEQKLRSEVLLLGIDVPTFFSGLHHGSDPAGNSPWDDATRTNPWFTTEFWTSWYNDYGAQNTDFTTRGTWKILAFGGNGYNYYMLHGGTNFGSYNNDEDASSYDYGSAIGQAGDLRPLYYKFKEAALFAITFQSILENSGSSTGQYAGAPTNAEVAEYSRTGPAGTIIFLDNKSRSDLTTQVAGGRVPAEPAGGPATIAEQMMLPVVEHFQLTPSITIDQSVSQILTSVTNGPNTTLAVYGPTGGSGSVELSSASAFSLISGSGWTASDASHGILQLTYPATGTTSTILQSGADKLQILAMNEALADRTWPILFNDGTHLIIGPDYVGEASIDKGKKVVHVEYANTSGGSAVDLMPDFTQVPMHCPSGIETLPDAPQLTNWKEKTVDEAQPGFDDSRWLSAVEPPYMGADGDYSAYAWYRTTINASSAGLQYLVPATVRDRMIVFVDGKRVPTSLVTTHSAELDLTVGSHTLAILTAQYGRNKLVGYSGPIDTIDAKGLGAPVILSGIPKVQLTSWQKLPAVSQQPDKSAVPATSDSAWQPVALGTDIFNNNPGWAWYQSTIPVSAASAAAAAAGESLHFDCVDDNATVFCNGKLVGSHEGWDSGFDVDLTSAWMPGQTNVISVLDENISGGGGISGIVTLSSSTAGGGLQGWRMRGSVGDPMSIPDWQPLAANPEEPALPTFYSAHFNGSPPSGLSAYPILRIELGGMSAGFVWLNGHNLGRYPEKIPVDGIYLPECWINKGDNKIDLFDEDGKLPTSIKLYTETAASRYDYTLSE
jgi:beta-galactosidase